MYKVIKFGDRQSSREQTNNSKTEATLLLCGSSGERANIWNVKSEIVSKINFNVEKNKREPTFTGPLQYILYCTVMYCTVLYCTVLYCTVRRSDVTPGGVKWIHSEYFRIWNEWNEMKRARGWMKWRKFADRQADRQTEILKTEATLSPVDSRGERANIKLPLDFFIF